MYNFIDVTARQGSYKLPAEAISIDGQYIEDAIAGYRTIYTQGREGLALEIADITVGTSNGAQVLSTRYPTRIITVGFQLISESPQSFRDKFNHLNNLLSADEADFVFADEPDKFFTGVPIAEIEVDPGTNSVTGEWQIYCADPFKYSLEPIVIEPTTVNDTSAEFVFDYNGTYPAKPVLQAEFAGALEGGTYSEDGDCGFVAFMDESENIIQLGNPEAVDIDAYAESHTPVNKNFTSIDSTWATSGGARYENRALSGSIAVNQAITDPYWNKGKGQTARYAKPSYGSGAKWHGPEYWKPMAAGSNFTVTAVHRMCANNTAQIGSFELSAYNLSNNTILAGIVIDKSKSGNNATLRYIVDGKQVGSVSLDLSYYNTHFGYCKRTQVTTTKYYNKKKKKWQTKKISGAKKKVTKDYKYTQSNLNIKIAKAGNQVTFKVGNAAEKKYTVDGINALAAGALLMYYGAYGTNKVLNTNATKSVKVVQLPSDDFADLANVFTAGDIVEADCSNATVTLRSEGTEEGRLEPQYGALGNDWEDFALARGTNQIQAVWSDWVNPTYKPTVRIIYNEVYL